MKCNNTGQYNINDGIDLTEVVPVEVLANLYEVPQNNSSILTNEILIQEIVGQTSQFFMNELLYQFLKLFHGGTDFSCDHCLLHDEEIEVSLTSAKVFEVFDKMFDCLNKSIGTLRFGYSPDYESIHSSKKDISCSENIEILQKTISHFVEMHCDEIKNEFVARFYHDGLVETGADLQFLFYECIIDDIELQDDDIIEILNCFVDSFYTINSPFKCQEELQVELRRFVNNIQTGTERALFTKKLVDHYAIIFLKEWHNDFTKIVIQNSKGISMLGMLEEIDIAKSTFDKKISSILIENCQYPQC